MARTADQPTRFIVRERLRHRRLVLKWLGLVLHVVRRIRYCSELRCLGTEDDLIQVGTLGLIRAAERYDPARGVSFKTYAYTCIKNRIFRDAKGAGVIRVPTYLVEQARTDALAGSPLLTLAETALKCRQMPELVEVIDREHAEPDADADQDAERVAAIMAAMRGLTPRQRRLLDDYFGLTTGVPMTCREIAQRDGTVTKQAIHWRLLRVMELLRVACGVDGRVVVGLGGGNGRKAVAS